MKSRVQENFVNIEFQITQTCDSYFVPSQYICWLSIVEPIYTVFASWFYPGSLRSSFINLTAWSVLIWRTNNGIQIAFAAYVIRISTIGLHANWSPTHPWPRNFFRIDLQKRSTFLWTQYTLNDGHFVAIELIMHYERIKHVVYFLDMKRRISSKRVIINAICYKHGTYLCIIYFFVSIYMMHSLLLSV